MSKDNVPEMSKWVLTESAFAYFLRWLDSDERSASEKYERLRQKLHLFFEHRGCQIPDELTDKALDRVIRKLSAGEDLSGTDPAAYCYGVAHKILKEYWRSPARQAISLDSQQNVGDSHASATFPLPVENEHQETERNLECLHDCLQRLSPEDRELITRYYEGDHRGRITSRHELAERLGISPGSLRIRALRIRERLRQCISRSKKSNCSR